MNYRRELNRHFDSFEESGDVLNLERARVLLSQWLERLKRHSGATPTTDVLDAMIEAARVKREGR
ncbi:MAG: hypothetical protein JXA20_17925 [Spirochaetes bacterium]|nr:hypothetical protein [Spirochaetota bacterium]